MSQSVLHLVQRERTGYCRAMGQQVGLEIRGQGVTASRFVQLVTLTPGHSPEPVLPDFPLLIHALQHTVSDAGWYARGMQCATETRTALYRFYDAHENLLYVGITNDPWRRWRRHVLEKPWYPQVKHQSVTWYDTERQARKAETRAIRSEYPQFNIAGAIRPPEVSPRLRLRFDPVIQTCAWWACVPGLLGVATIALGVAAPSAGAFCAHMLGWAMVVTFLSLPIPICAASLAVGSAQVYRFGRWLDLNFSDRKCQTRERKRA